MKLIFELYRATSKSKDVPRSQKLLLNSNDRLHFQQKAKITSDLRKLSHMQAIAYLMNLASQDKNIQYSKTNPCGVTITVYSPTNRRSDPDNVQPTVKALMDGFTDSGLWTDDSHEIVKFTKYQYGGLSGSKAYRLELDIESVEI